MNDVKDYKICEDNIIRRRVGSKWNPACPNHLLQPLLEKLQDNGSLSYADDLLYGQCILSLIEIVLNNKHFKLQTDEIKDECRGEMLKDVLVNCPKTFDRTKGSTAYSYCFRTCYTAGIHVLERFNIMRELLEYTDYSNECSEFTNLNVEEDIE